MNERLVWIDCEMTGLDLRADALIEVAALVTDFDLNVLGDGVDIIVKPPPEALDQMIDFVRTMHETSGLLDELAGGVTLGEAEEQVMAYLAQHCPPDSRPPLAGNSVATDRGFLARDMPALDAFLHYRIVDVSSIKELARRWYPRAYYNAPAKRGNHRALADIQESIEELRYYREAVFVPQPGPDSATARSIAAKHDATPAQVVIAWHLAIGNVVIPKSVTESRIRENFAALDVSLDAEDIEAINALDRSAKGEGRIGADPAVSDFA